MAKKSIETKKETEKDLIDIVDIKRDITKFIDDKKEDLTKEVIEKLDEHIEFKVDKRMKEEERRFTQRQKMRIIRQDVIIVLLLCVIGYMGYCLYEVDYFGLKKTDTPVQEKPQKQENPTEPTEPVTEKPTEPAKDSKYYIEKYGSLVEKIKIEDKSVFELFDSKTTIKNISNDLKLKIAYKNLEKNAKEEDKKMISFTKDSLKESAESIFGRNIELEDDMFDYGNIKFMFYNDTYIGLKEESTATGFTYEIVDAAELEDTLIFKVLVAKELEGSLYNLEDEMLETKYDDQELSDYKEKIKSFKITFEKTDEDYYFSSIEEEKRALNG